MTLISLPKIVTERSEIHGKGLFAHERIEELTLICEEVVRNRERASSFLFDGPLRWVNHSDDPNAVLSAQFDSTTGKLRLQLVSVNVISSGEEITYDYNLAGHGGQSAPCNCGQPNCNGSFHLRTEFGEQT